MVHFYLIDLIRVYAVSIVVVAHFFETPFKGHLGVDVFFVISGFVFCHTFFEKAPKFGDIIPYYVKRVRRLVPAMLATVLVSVVLGYLIFLPYDIKKLLESSIASLLFNANHYFLLTQDYFGGDAGLKPLLHFWSLGVEEQFYLVFPILSVVFLSKRKASNFFLMALGVGSLAYYIFISYPNSFYLLPARAFEFIIGILAYRLKREFIFRVPVLFFLTGSLFLFPCLTAVPDKVSVTVVSLLTGLVLASIGQPRAQVRCHTRVLRQAGLLTYPVYLVHQPFLAFSRYRFGVDALHSYFFLYIASCLGFAVLLQKITERSRFGKIERGKARYQVLSSSWFVMTITLFGLYFGGYFSNLYIPVLEQQQIEAMFQPNYGIGKQCDSRSSSDLSCVKDSSSVLFWGDSYAMHTASAPSYSQREFVSQATMSSCAPIFDVAKTNEANPVERAKRCLEFNSALKSRLSQSTNIEYVVMASVFDFDDNTKFIQKNGVVRRFTTDEIVERIRETVSFLEANGYRIYIVTPTPSNRTNIGACLRRTIMNKIAMEQCDFDQPLESDIEVALKTTFPEVVFDTQRALCVDGRCSVSIDGVPVYVDDGHVTIEGSKKLYSKLIKDVGLQ